MTCTRKKLKANDGRTCGICCFPVDINGHCNIGSCPNWYYRCEVHGKKRK